jgi:choline-sulfatase
MPTIAAHIVNGVFIVLPGALFAAPAPQSPTPNLVLITLDTTRADHLGAWGWPHAQTPNLDALAARGTRFARCDTAAPITLPSHATILSGLFPPRHGVRDNGTFVLASKVETVAELLAARGYDTGAVVSAVVLERRHGLDQGFRVYDDDLGEGYAAGTLVAERPAEGATAAALTVMKSLKPPFFLWVHYFDPHEEYRPPTRFADRARGPHRLYDGEISAMDEQIGALLGKLPPGTNVVAVGDHGEMLGEHGELTHGLLLYRGVRRVPLILAGPGVPAGRVSDSLVRTADVAPTLLTLAGAPVPAGLDGRSLLPIPTSSRQTYTESFLPFFAYKWYPLRSLGGDRYFYLKAPKSSVYDLKADAAEARDLAPHQPDLVRTWEKNLAGFLKQQGDSLDLPVRPNTVLTEEQRRKLASLGYTGGSTRGPVRADLPDPRTMTEVAQALHQATRKVQEGKCAEALRELDAIVKRDPHNFPALSSAGFCLRQLGRTGDALALFQRAARENDLDPIPITDAAGCLRDLGRRQEAEREYRRALALDPGQPVAAANLARMLRERGETKEALAVLDTAVKSGTHEPEVYLERAVARASISGMGGTASMAEALADFREAARRNPNDAVALEGAARASFQLGRHREAVQIYEQLLRSQPNRLDLWKTAGAIYLYELDERPSALRCFRRALTLEVSPAERAKLEELIKDLDG